VFQSARQIGSEAFLNLLFNEIISHRKGEHGVVNIQVNTCKGMDSRVIGRKLEGSFVLPFL
jgi:hypothetical protein